MSEKKRRYWINNHKYDDKVKDEYFKWLLEKVNWHALPREIKNRGYSELISFLMEKEYYYNGLRVMHDMNNYEFATHIRAEFNMFYNNNKDIKDEPLDTSFASVMDLFVFMVCYSYLSDLSGKRDEVVVNLSEKDKNAWHPEAVLFEMFMNLGLDYYDNDNFDPFQVDYILDVWMHKEYRRNGWGSPMPLDGKIDVEYCWQHITDTRDMELGMHSRLYVNENRDRFEPYIYKKDFYKYFSFKHQKAGYHFSREKALKIQRKNYFGVNIS